LRNVDLHVFKFLTTVFEARYPETLGVVLIHNAPFVFWGKLKLSESHGISTSLIGLPVLWLPRGLASCERLDGPRCRE
jgi:hypothetical protein